MTERPILFSGPMVRAILAGKKTQTRRVVRIDDAPISKRKAGGVQSGIPTDAQNVRHLGPYLKCDAPAGSATVSSRVRCPYGDPGDRLWVRETWALNDPPSGFIYRADELGEPPAWRPSIFMPRKASRLTLEVAGVRVERLQACSEADAIAEGVTGPHDVGYPAYRFDDGDKPRYSSAVAAYEAGWDTINGTRAPWASNPWVWVIEFRRAP